MDLLEKELPKLKKVSTLLFFIFGIVVFVIIGIAFYIFRPIQIEEYCIKRATNITGDKLNMLVEPSKEELRSYPNLMKKGDKITLYYREFLKCSSEQKLFYLF